MKTRVLLLAGVITLLGINFSWSQLGLVHSARANIPFPFVVEKTTLPAGEYDFVVANNLESIRVVSVKSGPSAEALVITALGGEIHTTPNDSHIVFDVVGNTHFFSELWIPGMDGFLVHATKGKHTHKTITTPK
jgi:hypothetical protein